MIERFAPNGKLSRCVAAMTFVRDDHVEGMDRNVEFLCVFIYWFVSQVENRIAPKEIDGHPLDGADVDERIPLLRFQQIGRWEHLRIKLLGFVKILTLKTLAID